MASAEDANTLGDSPQNGSAGSVAKPNGAKPSVDEIRKRAYKIFQERHGPEVRSATGKRLRLQFQQMRPTPIPSRMTIRLLKRQMRPSPMRRRVTPPMGMPPRLATRPSRWG